ncbi:MAG: phosphate butyryltransferase Ptb, partial [Oscillospiraceae bacterium]|nr:phosphate butyryltransferase Ptb [Oscillospiraceae bacterium]
MILTNFHDLADEAKKKTKKAVIAVVEAHDEHTLESVIDSSNDGVMIPKLIGNERIIRELLAKFGADPAKFDVASTEGPEESLKYAVDMLRAGNAAAVMKGKLESA